LEEAYIIVKSLAKKSDLKAAGGAERRIVTRLTSSWNGEFLGFATYADGGQRRFYKPRAGNATQIPKLVAAPHADGHAGLIN